MMTSQAAHCDESQVPSHHTVASSSPVEAIVRDKERLFRIIAENTNDVMVLGDLDMHRLYVSPATRTVLGFEPEEIATTRPAEFIHPDDAHVLADFWARVRSDPDGRLSCCVRHLHKGGHYVWLEVSVRLIGDPDTGRMVGYVASLRDVTARRNAEEQIRHMAVHDALTGLPNRTLFRDRLERAFLIAQGRTGAFAVLACDLDRFKAVNDTLGHQAGDALLRVVADRLRGVLREGDTVARLGGDEFAIILAEIDGPQTADAVARRVIAAMREPIALPVGAANVGVSIGIALGPRDGTDADTLFHNADIALYRAKAGRGDGYGTGYSFYEPGMDAAVAERNSLERDLRLAIEQAALTLHYQPIVETAGKTVGFEALLRWTTPDGRTVPPVSFIPIAEETGLIVPLGAWVLREACHEAARWPGELRVAVNVSAVQFQQPGLEAAVLQALAASSLLPHRLELEITESVLLHDSDSALDCLHRLRGLGVRIALDDFGTGYSSLSYLRRFPFDKIKIDRTFVRDIADPDAAAIVRAVVGIGERLGMGIVAEGVETAEQLDLVRREGCTQIQGYLFSHPLRAEDARAYVSGRPSEEFI